MFIILFICLFLILAFFGITFIVYLKAFRGKHKTQEELLKITVTPGSEPYVETTRSLMNELNALPYESIEITSYDGIKLFGHYYHKKDGAPVDICFHGWHGTYLQDFCGGSKLCFSLGHNVLLIDERGQGKSGSNTMTFGVKEKYDAVSWCNYIVERFGAAQEINLIGISMGAATVLQAATLELPPNVKHIFADCPYASPVGIILNVAENVMHIPGKLALPLIIAAARIYGHFDVRDKTSDVVQNIKNCKIPILIIHGAGDTFVPEWMSKQVADANPNIKRYTFPNADHGMSYMLDKERYEKIVKEFLI